MKTIFLKYFNYFFKNLNRYKFKLYVFYIKLSKKLNV